MSGQFWHRRRRRKPWKLEILLDTGAGGGSYVSLALWHGVKKLFARKLDRSRSGRLVAANPSDSNVAPMPIVGSVSLPILFDGDTRAREVPVRVVKGLPYACIIGHDFFLSRLSILDYGPNKGFRPVPGAPWIPFTTTVGNNPAAASPLCIARDHFASLTLDPASPAPARSAPAALPDLPTYTEIAWEDESTLEWDLFHVPEETTVPGFTSSAIETAAMGPQPQDRQLVLVLPTERFDLSKGNSWGVARGVMWWTPGSPVYCKAVNGSPSDCTVVGRTKVAHMIALNVRDRPRFESLFDRTPCTMDPPMPEPPLPPAPSPPPPPASPEARVSTANLGTLGKLQKQQLVDVLVAFIQDGLFPIDPKRVPACIDGELELPLINEFCNPYAAKQRRFSPEERRMIRAEIQKLLDRGIIRRSLSPWAAQCLCVKKKDGTLRLCIDWRELNKRLVTDSGGLGDMQTIFDGLKGKRFFTQLDLASGYHQIEIAEKDRHKTAFRDADGLLYEFNRAGFGLAILPAAFTRRVKTALGGIDGVFSWLDDILIASETWEEHLTTLTLVLNRLLAAGLSVNFAKCIFGAASQEFLGMIIDCTGMRPAPSKLDAIARMPCPRTVEDLRTFLGLTGYLRQFVPNYSLTAAPLTDILRNKTFASKQARKLSIPWEAEHDEAFRSLRATLASPSVLAFPDPNRTFELHTDASTIGAGAVLRQPVGDAPGYIAFASHRFSRTDSKRGPTERECMGILWAIDHFRPYLAGREFKLVTDCSALTWLFRSRELCPKLHRWALRLMEYDIVLEWRAGLEHVLPDAFSRLPHMPTPQDDIDDSFPDDFTSPGPADESPQGPTLDGVRLAELPPFTADNDDKSLAYASSPESAALTSDFVCTLHELPFASCAALNQDLREVRRGSRVRTPSVRLQPPGSIQLPPQAIRAASRSREYTPTPVESILPTPSSAALPTLKSKAAVDDILKVLSAGGEVPQGALDTAATGPASASAVDEAVRILSKPATLAQRQKDDALLGQVRRLLEGGESGREDVPVVSDGYSVDADGVLRFRVEGGKNLPAIPQSLVTDILALTHSLIGHAGVGATLCTVRKHFHWPTMTQDTRQYVLSCSCGRRKRQHSRRLPMMPVRHLEPWDELEMDILQIDTPATSGNKYVLLVVDRASKFPFGFPLESKQAVGVARILADLCLTFGVPKRICCDGAKEFGSDVVTSLCKWLKAEIRFGPADHPRGQGAAERLGGWLVEMLAELCRTWPERWDEYVSPAIWIKRTLPDMALPSKLTPFELLFGRPPRTSLDSLVPTATEAEGTGGLDNFVERRKQNMREVGLALERRSELKEAARAHENATISRPSAGVSVEQGSLVLVREADSARHRDNRGRKLQHDLYTGPWEVAEVLQTGLSVEVRMRGRRLRTRRVSLANVKPFHLRPPALRHSLVDEFAQSAWDSGFGQAVSSEAPRRFTSIVDCRKRSTDSGTTRWEFKGRFGVGGDSEWLAEAEMLKEFTPLQLDRFVALWRLYHPQPTVEQAPAKKANSPLPRGEALRLFPLGFVLWRDFGNRVRLKGQVFDYRHRYWRVRYSDNNWEELSRREMERLVRSPAP